jgi:hypothetical protein
MGMERSLLHVLHTRLSRGRSAMNEECRKLLWVSGRFANPLLDGRDLAYGINSPAAGASVF